MNPPHKIGGPHQLSTEDETKSINLTITIC
jgi:hypothetical protein